MSQDIEATKVEAKPRYELWLKFIPVLAVVIAALSATASGISSYYAYRSQTAAYRSILFQSQYEVAAGTAADISGLMQRTEQFLYGVERLLPLADAWLSYQAGKTRLSDLQIQNLRGEVSFQTSELKRIFGDMSQYEQALSRNIIKLQLLFPPHLREMVSKGLERLMSQNEVFDKIEKIVTVQHDAVFNRDQALLDSVAVQNGEIQTAILQGRESLKLANESFDVAFTAIAQYLDIESVEQELRQNSLSVRPAPNRGR